jgi:hypothetical protein
LSDFATQIEPRICCEMMRAPRLTGALRVFSAGDEGAEVAIAADLQWDHEVVRQKQAKKARQRYV